MTRGGARRGLHLAWRYTAHRGDAYARSRYPSQWRDHAVKWASHSRIKEDGTAVKSAASLCWCLLVRFVQQASFFCLLLRLNTLLCFRTLLVARLALRSCTATLMSRFFGGSWLGGGC